MTDRVTSLAELTAWLERFGALVRTHGDELGDASGLSDGVIAVMRALDLAPISTAEELFKTASMTIVSFGGSSGPFYGTFLLRFGMHAGPSDALDAPALAGALRAGLEGAVARSGATSAVEVLTRATEAFEHAVEEGKDAVTAASLALTAARSVSHDDAPALTATLVLEALAAALGESGE